MTDHRALAVIAARQFGLFTAAQARSAGFARRAIRTGVDRGRWQRVHREVFSISGVPSTWEQRLLAAALAAGNDSVVSHRAAAMLWELPGVGRGVPELSTHRQRHLRLAGVRTHRSVFHLGEERTVLHGIPVSTPARVIVDLSGRQPFTATAKMLDDACRRAITTPELVHRCVVGLPPAPGRRPRIVRALLAQRIAGYDETESVLELRVLRAIVGASLPEPTRQHVVRIGARAYRLDLAYPELRLAIEVDGFEWYRTRGAFDHDRRRSNDLLALGWRIVHITSAMTDTEIVAAVAAALALPLPPAP